MRGENLPSVNLKALLDLRQLILECKGSPVATTPTFVQTGSKPRNGDPDDDQKQNSVQTGGSLRIDSDSASMGKVAPNDTQRTHSDAEGVNAQFHGAETASTDSQGRQP